MGGEVEMKEKKDLESGKVVVKEKGGKGICCVGKKEGEVQCCHCCGYTFGEESKQSRLNCGLCWFSCTLFWVCFMYGLIMQVLLQFTFGSFWTINHNCPYIDVFPWNLTQVENGKEFIMATGVPFDFKKYPSVKESQVDRFYFKSRDGIQLHAWYTQGKPGMPAILIAHGRHMCMGKYEAASRYNILNNAGYTVMAIDYRNHGRSGDNKEKLLTWGVEEAIDVLSGWDYLQNVKNFTSNKIGIVGSSMGGATVSVAMALEPRIRSTWADSPACGLNKILHQGIASFAGGIAIGVAPPIENSAFLQYKFKTRTDVIGLQPELLMSKARPTQHYYFIATDVDSLIPYEASHSCYNAIKSTGAHVEYWLAEVGKDFNCHIADPSKNYVPNNCHVVAELYYPELYNQRIVNWFNTTLN